MTLLSLVAPITGCNHSDTPLDAGRTGLATERTEGSKTESADSPTPKSSWLGDEVFPDLARTPPSICSQVLKIIAPELSRLNGATSPSIGDDLGTPTCGVQVRFPDIGSMATGSFGVISSPVQQSLSEPTWDKERAQLRRSLGVLTEGTKLNVDDYMPRRLEPPGWTYGESNFSSTEPSSGEVPYGDTEFVYVTHSSTLVCQYRAPMWQDIGVKPLLKACNQVRDLLVKP